MLPKYVNIPSWIYFTNVVIATNSKWQQQYSIERAQSAMSSSHLTMSLNPHTSFHEHKLNCSDYRLQLYEHENWLLYMITWSLSKNHMRSCDQVCFFLRWLTNVCLYIFQCWCSLILFNIISCDGNCWTCWWSKQCWLVTLTCLLIKPCLDSLCHVSKDEGLGY